jgi:hypothetical protein
MLASHQIGGAYVRRRFDLGTETKVSGQTLTREQVLAIPTANRNALLSQKIIELYPVAPLAEGQRRFVIHMGMGKFDVIEGRKLNDEPLSRAEAEAMVSPEERPIGRK